jgi:hypothetical protein
LITVFLGLAGTQYRWQFKGLKILWEPNAFCTLDQEDHIGLGSVSMNTRMMIGVASGALLIGSIAFAQTNSTQSNTGQGMGTATGQPGTGMNSNDSSRMGTNGTTDQNRMQNGQMGTNGMNGNRMAATGADTGAYGTTAQRAGERG